MMQWVPLFIATIWILAVIPYPHGTARDWRTACAAAGWIWLVLFVAMRMP